MPLSPRRWVNGNDFWALKRADFGYCRYAIDRSVGRQIQKPPGADANAMPLAPVGVPVLCTVRLSGLRPVPGVPVTALAGFDPSRLRPCRACALRLPTGSGSGEGGFAYFLHRTTAFSPSRSARATRACVLAAVFEP